MSNGNDNMKFPEQQQPKMTPAQTKEAKGQAVARLAIQLRQLGVVGLTWGNNSKHLTMILHDDKGNIEQATLEFDVQPKSSIVVPGRAGGLGPEFLKGGPNGNG